MRGAIRIVTPGDLAPNPRPTREAGALHDAGHDVTAVTRRYSEEPGPFDDAQPASVPWRTGRVRYGRELERDALLASVDRAPAGTRTAP